MKALVSLIIILLLAPTVLAANVAVGAFGYHPNQYKQVVVYTTETAGTFDIYNSAGSKVHTGTLAKPKDDSGTPITCQGGQPCLVGDFSSFTQGGAYTIKVGADSSQQFSISSNVFKDRSPLFMDVFEAYKQQGSAYHKDLHSQESPAFLAMTDGSFVMPVDHLAIAGIRLASAYNRNPSLLSFNNYQTTNAGAPDVAEHIKQHVQIMQSYQDAAGGTQVAYGYQYNFNCPMEYRPDEERYTTAKNSCLLWISDTSVANAAQALHLYAIAIPTINQLDGAAAATALLERAQRTHAYVKGQTLSGDTAASFGAASFMLYDYTGNVEYLRDAHNQRAKVEWGLDSVNTRSREYYWEEYARHKAQITAAGLQYEMGGKQPDGFFKQKIHDDWGSSQNPIMSNGERIYTLNSDFQNSRYMLSESLFAAKAQEFAPDQKAKIVADTHLAWLTGMNSVQEGDGVGDAASDAAAPKRSMSFIFGIGSHGRNQHIRIVQPNFYQDGQSYLNGKKFINGWISGALDSFNDDDKVMNYHDDFWSWKYVETTDEIVAMAVELNAYLDAQYNGRQPLARPRLSSTLPVCTPAAETCDQKDNDCDGQVDEGNVCAPVCTPATEICDGKDNNCNGQVDENNVCAPVPACESILEDVLPDGYTVEYTINDQQYEITLISLEGGATFGINGEATPVLQEDEGVELGNGIDFVMRAFVTEETTNENGALFELLSCEEQPVCTPTTETCNQKDDDCDGQIDEGSVCAPACTPTAEVCDQKDNDCDGAIDENNACAPTTQTCHTAGNSIPATCNGGTISDQVFGGGCRTITCTNENSSLKVMACDKPDATPTHFEMYMQQRTGAGIEICIGSTCISDGGFAKSPDYPICTAGNTPPEQPPEQPQEPVPEPPRSRGGGGGGGGAPAVYPLSDTPKRVTLYGFSTFSFDLDKQYAVRVKEIDGDRATITIGSAEVTLRIAEAKNVEITGDNTDDVHVTLLEIVRDRIALNIRTAMPEVEEVEDIEEVEETSFAESVIEETPESETQVEAAASVEPEQLFEAEDPAVLAGYAVQEPDQESEQAQRQGSPFFWILGAVALVALAGAMIYRRQPPEPISLQADQQPVVDPVQEPEAAPEAPPAAEELDPAQRPKRPEQI